MHICSPQIMSSICLQPQMQQKHIQFLSCIRFPQTQPHRLRPAQHLKNIPTTNQKKKHSLTPLMQIKLPVHKKRSQLSTLPSNPIYQSQSTQPCVPSQPSLYPYQTQSHNAHPPSQESYLPSPGLQQHSFDVLGQLQDMKHQMSHMQQAQNLMLQNLMNNMWPMLPGQKTYYPTPLCLSN